MPLCRQRPNDANHGLRLPVFKEPLAKYQSRINRLTPALDLCIHYDHVPSTVSKCRSSHNSLAVTWTLQRHGKPIMFWSSTRQSKRPDNQKAPAIQRFRCLSAPNVQAHYVQCQVVRPRICATRLSFVGVRNLPDVLGLF